MYDYSHFEHSCAERRRKFEVPLSEDYRVFVNRAEAPVYTCRISAYPFNRLWPGYQRDISQTVPASYVNIVSDEEIEIEVQINHEYEKLSIRPYSKNIHFTDDGKKIRFKLSENGQFVLETGSFKRCLYIFNSKPIEAPNENDVTYYFGAGVHFPGKITLKSNESVYVDKDAYVLGVVYAENAENIRIFGNGIFDGSGEERPSEHCYENYTNGNLKFYDCKNVGIEGVGMHNSAIWCLNIFGCENVTADDIKIFGQWRYNTDGVDIVNSREVLIKNSLIHSFDDTITIKGIPRYCERDNENIRTDNCVLWCDWGKCCEVGIETLCRKYKNISFTNCDILRGMHAVLDISNGDVAEISDIVFENINVEYNSFDTEPMYQRSDNAVYDKENARRIPTLIQIRNSDWIAWNNDEGALGRLKRLVNTDTAGITPFAVHDVKINNINIYCDTFDNESTVVRNYIKSSVEGLEFYNIDISNIKLNGKTLTNGEMLLLEDDC